MNGETETQKTVEDRKSEFVAVEGGQETSSAGTLLVAAYILMWAAAFGMIWLSLKRTKALGSRLSSVEAALRQADKQHES